MQQYNNRRSVASKLVAYRLGNITTIEPLLSPPKWILLQFSNNLSALLHRRYNHLHYLRGYWVDSTMPLHTGCVYIAVLSSIRAAGMFGKAAGICPTIRKYGNRIGHQCCRFGINDAVLT